MSDQRHYVWVIRGINTHVSTDNGPFYLLGFWVVAYYLFSLPMSSSFPSSSPPEEVLKGVERAVHTVWLVFGPGLFQLVLHHRSLLSFSTPFDVWALHMSTLALLFAAPLLLLRYLSPKRPLSWTGIPPPLKLAHSSKSYLLTLDVYVHEYTTRPKQHRFGKE